MCDVYLNIAICANVTFCIIGVLTARHKMYTNFSRPSSLPKKGKGLGVRLGWGMIKKGHISNIHKPYLHLYPYVWCLEKLSIRVGVL